MNQKLLSLQTLPLVDGGQVEKKFNEHLAMLAKDCIDRPLIGKVRKLTIHVELTPFVTEGGVCDDVQVDFEVLFKRPSDRARPYLMRSTNKGGLRFQPESPLAPDAEQED